VTATVEFGTGNERWLRVRASGSGGLNVAGGPLPVLTVPLEFSRLKDSVDVEIDRLAMTLSLGNTLIGVGELGPCPTFFGPSDVQVKFRLPQAALPLLLEPLPETGRVQLAVRMTGHLRFRRNRQTAEQVGGQQEPEAWQQMPVFEYSADQLDIGVARSDWYDQVVAPLRLGSYLVTALGLPDPAVIPGWAASLDRLRDAERALTIGDPAAVFGQCRGAFDALPDAKQHMFAAMSAGEKRDAIDALARAIGVYLHKGRHVVPVGGGTQAGEFPVDRADARFAYHLTQLLLAHTAHLTFNG